MKLAALTAGRISFVEKLLFTKHLSTMLKAGIPLTEALETLEEQTRSPSFKAILENIYQEIESGHTLAHALKRYPHVFDGLYVSLIEVSEESGTLETNLDFLAGQLTKTYNLRKKLRSAMLYPALIITATFSMGGGVAVFLLPKLVDVFESLEVELPLSTKLLLFIVYFLNNYYIHILLGVLVIILGLRLLVKVASVTYVWHGFILKLPLIGALVVDGQLAHFSRNLGVLLKSGVPIVRSLEVTRNSLSNVRFKRDLEDIISSVNKGKDIGETLRKKHLSEFPLIVTKMISVGEKSGKLDEALLYLGDFYEEEIDEISKNITVVLEPFLLICIGFVVLFVLLAILGPIYSLTGSLRR